MPIRVCFVLFVFSIPFEHVQFSELMSDFTFAKMAGILLFCVALLQPMVCFARPPKAFWCFVAYLGVYSLLAFVRVNFGAQTLNSIFTLAQCMIFFWISYNILRQGGMRKSVCAAFVLSNLVVALLTYFGVAATESETGSEIRFSAFGQDENVLGSMYAIGVLSAVALAVDKSVPFLARLSMIPALLLMFAKCASTGCAAQCCRWPSACWPTCWRPRALSDESRALSSSAPWPWYSEPSSPAPKSPANAGIGHSRQETRRDVRRYYRSRWACSWKNRFSAGARRHISLSFLGDTLFRTKKCSTRTTISCGHLRRPGWRGAYSSSGDCGCAFGGHGRGVADWLDRSPLL